MSELEQRARERFEKWMLEELHYDFVNEGLRRDDLDSYRYLEVQSSWMAWKYSADLVVRSIIFGMEERIRNLRMRASDSDNYALREVFDGAISELEAQIAGLKKKFGVE